MLTACCVSALAPILLCTWRLPVKAWSLRASHAFLCASIQLAHQKYNLSLTTQGSCACTMAMATCCHCFQPIVLFQLVFSIVHYLLSLLYPLLSIFAMSMPFISQAFYFACNFNCDGFVVFTCYFVDKKQLHH